MSDEAVGVNERPPLKILSDIAGSFLVATADGIVALLVPITSTQPPAERVAGDVRLSFHANVRFDVLADSFVANAALVEYSEPGLRETFKVLAESLALELNARLLLPTPQEVSQALARWEELLRVRRALTRDEEIGLWGELWALLQLPRTDMAVSTWRGPKAEWVDFVGGGIGIEIKASRRRLEHFVSQEQLTRPLGDLRVYVLSLWVDVDVIEGRTLSDLVSEVDQRLEDRREFEQKLLGACYSRGDAHLYKLRLRVLEAPLVFPMESVPRVQAADPGVTQLRFMVSLNERLALTASTGLATMMRLCGD